MLLPAEENTARHPGHGVLANAHVEAWHAWRIRECLIQHLVQLTAARGTAWLEGYVAGWSKWPDLRADFWRQWRASLQQPGAVTGDSDGNA